MKHLLFALLTFWSNSTWSQTPDQLAKVYRDAHQRAQQVKNLGEFFATIAAGRSQADQQFVQKEMKAWSKITLPSVNFSPDGIDWTVEGKQYFLKILSRDNNTFKLNDREMTIDFDQPLAQVFKHLSHTTPRKNAGLTLLPRAHATSETAPDGAVLAAFAYLVKYSADLELGASCKIVMKRIERMLRASGQKLRFKDGELIIGEKEPPHVRITHWPEERSLELEYRAKRRYIGLGGRDKFYTKVTFNATTGSIGRIREITSKEGEVLEGAEMADVQGHFTRAYNILFYFFERNLRSCEKEFAEAQAAVSGGGGQGQGSE